MNLGFSLYLISFTLSTLPKNYCLVLQWQQKCVDENAILLENIILFLLFQEVLLLKEGHQLQMNFFHNHDKYGTTEETFRLLKSRMAKCLLVCLFFTTKR